jgi:hypothetical protein
MRRKTQRRPRPAAAVAAALAAAAVLATLVACTPPTPVERVSKLRAEYEAELNSFSIRETPVVAMGMEEMEGEEAMADAGAMEEEGAMEGEDGGEEMQMSVRQDAVLDIVLRKTGGTDTLAGVTVDIYQVSADETEKATYRVFVDAARLNPGSRKAVSHVLEDVDYEEGDGFAVELRQPVPPELYGEYQEYAEALEGGSG